MLEESSWGEEEENRDVRKALYVSILFFKNESYN